MYHETSNVFPILVVMQICLIRMKVMMQVRDPTLILLATCQVVFQSLLSCVFRGSYPWIQDPSLKYNGHNDFYVNPLHTYLKVQIKDLRLP